MRFLVTTPAKEKVILYQGDANSGLTHIMNRHFADFRNKDPSLVNEDEIRRFLSKALKTQAVLSYSSERHYNMGGWTLLIILGKDAGAQNAFKIITAMPADPSALRQTEEQNDAGRLAALSEAISIGSDGLFASEELSPYERIARALAQHHAMDIMKISKK
jgi:hypothetical protein